MVAILVHLCAEAHQRGRIKGHDYVERGFVEPITKNLPLEYAVELHNLI